MLDSFGISENMQRLRLDNGLLLRIILLRLGRRSCSDMNDNMLCDMLRAINCEDDKNEARDMLVILLWEISEESQSNINKTNWKGSSSITKLQLKLTMQILWNYMTSKLLLVERKLNILKCGWFAGNSKVESL